MHTLLTTDLDGVHGFQACFSVNSNNMQSEQFQRTDLRCLWAEQCFVRFAVEVVRLPTACMPQVATEAYMLKFLALLANHSNVTASVLLTCLLGSLLNIYTKNDQETCSGGAGLHKCGGED